MTAEMLLLAVMVLNPVLIALAVLGGLKADQFAKTVIAALGAGAVGALAYWLFHQAVAPVAEPMFPIAGLFISYMIVAFAIAAIIYRLRPRKG